jgi:flagella basal body P-ring formation protein FlgA
MIIISLLLAASGSQPCRLITDDVIRMRDLAAAAPVFDVVGPEAVVAYSPLPGATRVMQGSQLARLAKRYGITGVDFGDLCFQRTMRQFDPKELLETLRRSLAIPAADVELVEFSRFPAPEGVLVFPRSGIGLSKSRQPLLWKGYVVYGQGHHFPVWARVRIHARLNRVVATDNLVTTKVVRADQVRIEPLDGVPDTLAPAQSIGDVVGKMLLHPVPRGATISLDDVSTAIAIHRGDKVDVDFDSPVIRLRFEAAAETDARLGEQVRLRNLQGSNTFMAEVSGRNQARVRVEETK